MRFFQNADFPFLSWRRKGYMVTALLLLLGIGAMLSNTLRHGSWLNYGVDFTGGTLVQLEFRTAVNVDQIRSAAAEAGMAGWEITRFGEANEFVVRMPTFSEEVIVDPAEGVRQVLAPVFGADAFEVVRTEAVGPKVGAELQQRALLAILISLLLTLSYIAFRFEWRTGVAAVIATSHDIIVTLGILALLRSEISIGTVAAFLTIVGYSLNDTIVVFDRVRENLAKLRRTPLAQTLDRSINETLPRTVLTSGTTLITLFSLYLFGGAVIRDFALVLILGIMIGTFSSIFVASPALLAIEGRWPRTGEKKNVRPSAPRRRDRVEALV
jgi:preprotein translocase subunit SecF